MARARSGVTLDLGPESSKAPEDGSGDPATAERANLAER